MGSQAIQSHLWGQRSKDWATIQEATGKAGYEYVLHFLQPKLSEKFLDIGCGSGLFANLAAKSGAEILGFDATAQLIEEAKLRNPSIKFLTGEMEALPFDDNTFDIVSGFNSFQYAANVKAALAEAKRVLKENGKLVVMIWGNKEDCEAASYLKAVRSLLPPPPPGAGGPFALTEKNLLENILEEIGLKIIDNKDVESTWDYPDTETALKGLLSAGPAVKAIEHAGYEKVHETILAAVQPYIQSNGYVVYKNKFRIVISEK
ncbi:MAG: class I SAM-dependent methyltransferase [Arachidicoccus sp.]|nr:class I SAM-dependent methyltransferase [Arachidicoccus sp.]